MGQSTIYPLRLTSYPRTRRVIIAGPLAPNGKTSANVD